MNIEQGAGYSLLALVLALIGAGCTLADGEPWGYVDGELQSSEPQVGEAFEVDELEVEVNAVRLVEQVEASGGGGEFDPQNPPPGCSLCHGGHCHCDGELVDYEDLEERVAEEGTSRRTLAALEPTSALTLDGAVELDEASVTEATGADLVEVELEGVRVDGTLSIDGTDYETTLSLPGIGGTRLNERIDLAFGPDEPFERSLDVDLEWPDDWLQGVDLDQLETRNDDSEILIASSANRDAATQIAEQAVEATLEVRVTNP